MNDQLVFSVSDFVAVFNQTVEYAYPLVTVQGELANFRVSKNKWVYFDLKDEFASLKFFGTVYQLPGPLEDGLLMEVSGQPRLHPLYGFSITIQALRPVGDGSLKRAAALLEAKLRQEGLFDESRKRSLPYPPRRVGLITSHESAAYHDFIKVLNSRWGGLEIVHHDVQVQGQLAPEQLVGALEYFNTHDDPVDVIVMTRGGGSAEDLVAFSTEQLTRAVAASRTPILVAIGHEVDVSLAELAADQRASTPSNAAELLVPDRRSELERLAHRRQSLFDLIDQSHQTQILRQKEALASLNQSMLAVLTAHQQELVRRKQLLAALNPEAILKRGYAVARTQGGRAIRTVKDMKNGDIVTIQVADGRASAEVQ